MSVKAKARRRWLQQVSAGTAALCMPAIARSKSSDWVIGQSLPLSGVMAGSIQGLRDGQKLAIDEVNSQGGIDGRPVRLVELDDAFDPARTVVNVRQLVAEHRAAALLGTLGTAQTAAVLPLVHELRTPLIGIYSGSPALRAQHHPYLFPTQASYADELTQMVRNLKAVQFLRMAIVYQDNEFGRLMLPMVQKIVAREGGTVVASVPLEAQGADAVQVSAAAMSHQPQAILMIVAGPAVVPFVKASPARKGIPLYTLSLAVGSALIQALGDDAHGLAVARTTPYPWRFTTPLARNFRDQMQAAGKTIDYDHFAGYINGRIVIEGLRAAGKGAQGDAIAQALERLGTIDLQGYKVVYTPQQHHGSDFVEITVLGRDGRFLR